MINPDDPPLECSSSLSRADELVETAKEVSRSTSDVENFTPRLKEGKKVL